MLQTMRPKLTFANVMVVILAFVVLGGGAYAATQLPRNSVGTKQLKKGAVTKAKISKGTLRELQGAIGPAGANGPAGVGAAPGAPIPAGATLRGVAVTGTLDTSAGSSGIITGVSFGGSQLAARPTANIVPAGGSPTAACPGSALNPEAAPGNLCVYVKVSSPGVEGVFAVADPSGGAGGVIYNLASKEFKVIENDPTVARFGFQFSFSTEKGSPQLAGTWAVTGN